MKPFIVLALVVLIMAAESNGFLIWWADYGSQVFSEQPPSRMDLGRKPIARTTAGERTSRWYSGFGG